MSSKLENGKRKEIKFHNDNPAQAFSFMTVGTSLKKL